MIEAKGRSSGAGSLDVTPLTSPRRLTQAERQLSGFGQKDVWTHPSKKGRRLRTRISWHEGRGGPPPSDSTTGVAAADGSRQSSVFARAPRRSDLPGLEAAKPKTPHPPRITQLSLETAPAAPRPRVAHVGYLTGRWPTRPFDRFDKAGQWTSETWKPSVIGSDQRECSPWPMRLTSAGKNSVGPVESGPCFPDLILGDEVRGRGVGRRASPFGLASTWMTRPRRGGATPCPDPH